MRKLWILAIMPLLGACYTETAVVWQPVFMSAGGIPDEDFIVIQNINAPYECRVMRQTDTYPNLYRIVHGPVSSREGFTFVRDVCRTRPKQ